MRIKNIVLLLLVVLLFSCENKQVAEFSDFNEAYQSEEKSAYITGTKWDLKYIVVHCTASLGDKPISFFEKIWKNNGWKDVGYSYLVKKDGKIWVWKDHNFDAFIEDFEITNGVLGRNRNSVHIAYEGGVDQNLKPYDNITSSQIRSVEWLIKRHRDFAPLAKVVGHKDIQINTNKACPSFDVFKKFPKFVCDEH